MSQGGQAGSTLKGAGPEETHSGSKLLADLHVTSIAAEGLEVYRRACGGHDIVASVASGRGNLIISRPRLGKAILYVDPTGCALCEFSFTHVGELLKSYPIMTKILSRHSHGALLT